MIKAIAFNLPQFHPIPENDLWWGKGFTEWTNVAKARPLFKGHYQPHLPADLGFYDLRLAEAREAQAELAREYGIYGFCYYHYWFNGRRLLERPVNEITATGRPEFPFCLCWANENWTRRWDGMEDEILAKQDYSESDDENHIRHLMPTLTDPRYITVSGMPVFLVYRARRFPEPRRTTDIWRREAVRAGLPGLFLIRVESFPDETDDPRLLGFDAALEFQPRWLLMDGKLLRRRKWWHRHRLQTMEPAFKRHHVCEYEELVKAARNMEVPPYPFIRCVCPGFDNSSRRQEGAVILKDSTPEVYGQWLSFVVRETRSRGPLRETSEEFVFINAWNEWAEGNHLEPCLQWQRAYLEATREALKVT
ncbi:MAG: glycoside hydrolase family 99-like domain-containing protein [Acidobacteriota bacterium]